MASTLFLKFMLSRKLCDRFFKWKTLIKIGIKCFPNQLRMESVWNKKKASISAKIYMFYREKSTSKPFAWYLFRVTPCLLFSLHQIVLQWSKNMNERNKFFWCAKRVYFLFYFLYTSRNTHQHSNCVLMNVYVLCCMNYWSNLFEKVILLVSCLGWKNDCF